MATIKSYTDIEQSKKLAEILPLESADMHYNVVGDAVIGDYQSGMSSARSVAKAYKKNPDEFAKNVIPCWSLAALLEIIPGSELSKSVDDIGKWEASAWKDPDLELLMRVEGFDNPIDACYDMILKLRELKIL